jgi:plastocyanin
VPGSTARRLSPVVAIATALLLSLLSACGGNNPDKAKGKELFTQRCGSCHVLADANTKGTIGPDLDAAFQQSIADGLGRDTIAGVVRDQIALPEGGQMPANLVEGDDASAVAAYVGDVAGKPSAGATGPGGSGAGASKGGEAKANARNELDIPTDSTGQLLFKFSSASAEAGPATIRSKNDSSVPHNIALKGGGVNEEGPVVSGGKISEVKADLKPGKYEFYCSVPGHEQAGMKGTLTVK